MSLFFVKRILLSFGQCNDIAPEMRQVPPSCVVSGSRRTSLMCWPARPVAAPWGRSPVLPRLRGSDPARRPPGAPVRLTARCLHQLRCRACKVHKSQVRNWEVGKAFSGTASWNWCQAGFFWPGKHDGEPMCLLRLSFRKARPFTVAMVSFQGYYILSRTSFLN